MVQCIVTLRGNLGLKAASVYSYFEGIIFIIAYYAFRNRGQRFVVNKTNIQCPVQETIPVCSGLACYNNVTMHLNTEITFFFKFQETVMNYYFFK